MAHTCISVIFSQVAVRKQAKWNITQNSSMPKFNNSVMIINMEKCMHNVFEDKMNISSFMQLCTDKLIILSWHVTVF